MNKVIKIETIEQYDTAKHWAKSKGLDWQVRDWLKIWIYINEDCVEWDNATVDPVSGYEVTSFDDFFGEKLSFPFIIQCRDLHERDAAAAWLISHGCLVHGRENHLNGEYKELFHKDIFYLIVDNKRYFSGSGCTRNPDKSFAFFENVSKFSKLFEDEIKVGDWVVCIDTGRSKSFTEGKQYKVCLINDYIVVESDDSGEENGMIPKNFRKARPDEIPKLPKINGYDGKIGDGIVKYGCAKIDLQMLSGVLSLMGENSRGNRKISSITLDSGVKISKVEVEQILKVIQ